MRLQLRQQPIAKMIMKESSKKGGVKFSAIGDISYQETGELRLAIIEPDTPKLMEPRKDHFVSCLLFDYNYNDRKEESYGEAEGEEEKPSINL